MSILLMPARYPDQMFVNRMPVYGWLLTPRRPMLAGVDGRPFGVDNECYTLGDHFDDDRYMAALRRISEVHGASGCLFATAPDVVGDARATWERSLPWFDRIRATGLPVALVAQDGMESMSVDWSRFDALFVGGTTVWKLGPAAAAIVRIAQDRGMWVHVGRVNSTWRASRLRFAPDSVDGTGWIKTNNQRWQAWASWVRAGAMRQGYLWRDV